MFGKTNSMASSPHRGSFVTMEYPSGYTCTITNGTKTMTSPSGTTSYRFPIKDTGRWDITCTNGSRTKQSYINIGASPESYLFRFDNCITFSSASSFTLEIIGSVKLWDGTVEYSTDRSTWQTWSGLTTLSSASVDGVHKLFVRGYGNTVMTGENAATDSGAWHLVGSDISISGDSMDFIDYTQDKLSVGTYAFKNMFGWKSPGSTALVDASGFILTGPISDHCYYGTFSRNKGLLYPPKFPETSLTSNCYVSIFYQCEALAALPILSALILPNECYNSLFNGCTSIAIYSASGTGHTTEYRIPIDGTATIGTDVFLYTLSNTSGNVTGSDMTANTTYYTSNTVDMNPPWLVVG